MYSVVSGISDGDDDIEGGLSVMKSLTFRWKDSYLEKTE